MCLLGETMTVSGRAACCALAAVPTTQSPSSYMTALGRMALPLMLITSGAPRKKARTELVVPRSMPTSATLRYLGRGEGGEGGSAGDPAAAEDLDGAVAAAHPEV